MLYLYMLMVVDLTQQTQHYSKVQKLKIGDLYLKMLKLMETLTKKQNKVVLMVLLYLKMENHVANEG
jgi:hypothetical protein